MNTNCPIKNSTVGQAISPALTNKSPATIPKNEESSKAISKLKTEEAKSTTTQINHNVTVQKVPLEFVLAIANKSEGVVMLVQFTANLSSHFE